MLRTALIVATVGILVAAGVVANYRAGVYGEREDLTAAADKLHEVPKQAGTWVMDREFELDEKVRQRAEAVGYLDRSYRNEKTGEAVRVLMLCGDPGPIGAHSPEVCYGGHDMTSAGKRTFTVTVPVSVTPPAVTV